VVGFKIDAVRKALVLDVRPTKRRPLCGNCFRVCATGYDHRLREWRHTDLGETRVYLRFSLARVKCRRCGPTTQLVPWADHGAWHTYDFEDLVAYKAQGADQTRVAKDMRISWATVGKIVERVVTRKLGDASGLLDDLRRIGLDELSFRKHHEYVTIIVDHDHSRVVWVGEGKSSETVGRFFEALGSERSAKLELVSMDMSPAYKSAVKEHAPNAEIVFDRFHVQRLAHNALDQVRRSIMRDLKGTPEATEIKGSRHALQRSDVNLTPKDKDKLATVMATNEPLFRAWMLKTVLAAILDERDVASARTRLEAWLAWAARSQLKPFVRVGRCIREHLEGILAYVRTGISNGRSEGLNGKTRVITRRAFGFHSASSLIALLFLCCSGLVLTPRHA
jgi:transposase